MPRRVSVFDLMDILKRLRAQHSIKSIHRELGKHKTVIRRVKELAEEHQWLAVDQPMPTEQELHRLYDGCVGPTQQEKNHCLDEHKDEIKRWLDEKYSFVVIHQLLGRKKVGCSESTVRRYIHHNFPKVPKATMVRDTKAGEDMEVDFGYIGLCWDRKTKRRRKTWFFSARLCHSRRVYRKTVFDQKKETFFWAHIHAFEHFGGVPRKVRPDSLKAAIIRACWVDPLVNRSYRDLAEHYGFMISPCQPYSPEQKGGVESDVKYVKRNFLPLFKEHQRERGRETYWADELAEQLEAWNVEVCETRSIQKVGRTPVEIFESEERAALRPLPASRWDPVTVKEASVGSDWRVMFLKGFYTVPVEYIGQRVVVIGNSKIVRIVGHDLRQITSHARAIRDWQVMKKDEHAPENVQQYLNTSAKGLLVGARRIGPAVWQVATSILEDRSVDGIRPVRGLLRLAKDYSGSRLEAACRRAVRYDTATYRSVKLILKNQLDRIPEDQPVDPSGQREFRFQREPGYFDLEASDGFADQIETPEGGR